MKLKSLFVVFLFVAVNGKFAEWNEWSACTAYCGNGIAARERMLPPYGSDHCYSAIVQEKTCTGNSKFCKKMADIARGKPTTASSNLYNKYPSSRAVDGNYNTMFNVKSCMHTDKDMKPFLRIDLQKESDVEKVLIWNREDSYSSRLNNVYVTVGNDPNGFRNSVCGRIDNVTLFFDVLCGGILFGRYVHIRIPGPQYLTICEVEVIGAAITNVARGQSATQSTTYASSSTYSANKAVDGNRATYSNTNIGDKDPWLQINFGQERYIKRVELHPSSSRVYNATLTLGNSKNPTLNKVCAVIKDLGKITNHIVNCPPGSKGQYLTVHRLSSTTYMGMYELEAYGY